MATVIATAAAVTAALAAAAMVAAVAVIAAVVAAGVVAGTSLATVTLAPDDLHPEPQRLPSQGRSLQDQRQVKAHHATLRHTSATLLPLLAATSP
jgi:hypothetical protein